MRNKLESIRPVIPGIIIENKTGTMESFQNKTLRPILKFQNTIIAAIFRHHLEKHKITFEQLTKAEKDASIEKIFQKDRKIHHLLLGVVLGHFTDLEYQTYAAHQKELNQRILNLLVQRLQNQL